MKPLSECSLPDFLDELDASIVQANNEFERYCDSDDCVSLWGAYTAINSILGVVSPRPSPRASPRPGGSALSSPRGADGPTAVSPRGSDQRNSALAAEYVHEKENRKSIFTAYELIDGPVLKNKYESESLTYFEYLRALVRMRRRAAGESLVAESQPVNIDALMAGIVKHDIGNSGSSKGGKEDKDKNRFKEQGVKDAVRRATIRRFEADKKIQTGLLAFPSLVPPTLEAAARGASNSPRVSEEAPRTSAPSSSSAKTVHLLASTRPTTKATPSLARTSVDDTSLLTLNSLSLSHHTSKHLSELLQREKQPFPSGAADSVLPTDWFRYIQLYEDMCSVFSVLIWSVELGKTKNDNTQQKTRSAKNSPGTGERIRMAKRTTAVLSDFDINSMYGGASMAASDIMICTDDLYPLFRALLSARV